MRIGVFSAILLASGAFADEASDRPAIEKMIAAMAESPYKSSLYSSGFRFAEIEQLGLMKVPVTRENPDEPGHVVISKEPWGEATLDPQIVDGKFVRDRLEGYLVAKSIRFVTPDVALVDAVQVRIVPVVPRQGATGVAVHAASTTTPLLVVMSREESEWRIASIRKIAEP